MAEAKTKKTKSTDSAARSYPDTAADRAFRDDPYSRLLLLAHFERRSSPQERQARGDRGRPSIPLGATPEESSRIMALRAALARVGVTQAQGSEEKNREATNAALKELATDYPGLKGVSMEAAEELRRKVERASWGTSEGLIKSSFAPALIQALLSEMGKASSPKIPETELEAAFASGRLALSEKAGFNVERLDALKQDPELCLALCRLSFGGPTEFGATKQRSSEYDKAIDYVKIFSHSHSHSAEERASNRLMLALNHPLSGVVFAPDASLDHPFNTLGMAGVALGANGEWGEKARLALLRLTDTRAGSSWESMPASGEAAYYNPLKQSSHQARRKAGVAQRGEPARLALSQLGSIASWRTPLKSVEWGATPGLKYAALLAKEATAHQERAPEAVARALDELAARPSLRLEISSAFAARVAAGFSSLPSDASNDDFFPELASFRDRVDESAGASFSAGEAGRADAMGGVALAASKALGFTSDTPMALVGEAKRALADQAGVSPAAWKSLASSPELAKAFEKMMGMVKKKSSGARVGALKAAVEIMQAADRDGSAFGSALANCAVREAKMTVPEAAGRALSACAMSGVGVEAQTRLLHFLGQNEHARSIIAGRLPGMPSDWARFHQYNHDPSPLIGFEREADQALALKADVEALVERGPALAKGISERLERALAKAQKSGMEESRALINAHEQIQAMISDICDCARGQPTGFWAGLDKKDPLASAMRQHETWAQQERDRQAHANPTLLKKWRAEVGVMTHGRAEATELSVGIDLFNEGKAMSHCVGSYAERCSSGQSRIFSVRLDGVRQSTLELSPCSKAGGAADISRFDAESPESRAKIKGWAINQNRGKHNATNLSAELKDACAVFAQKYAIAFEANTLAIAKRLQEEKEAQAKERAEAKPKLASSV